MCQSAWNCQNKWKGYTLKRLKQLREAFGLSQQKLAEHFHLSQQSIYKYENGLAEPGIATLKAFAGFFHTSIDFLVGYADEETVPAQADCLKLTDTERCLLYHYRGLTPKMQRIVLELVKESEDYRKVSENENATKDEE